MCAPISIGLVCASIYGMYAGNLYGATAEGVGLPISGLFLAAFLCVPFIYTVRQINQHRTSILGTTDQTGTTKATTLASVELGSN
jgi:hypothetical protein